MTLKEWTLEDLTKLIIEDGETPSIQKGEIFRIDGELWRCTSNNGSRFKAKRIKK